MIKIFRYLVRINKFINKHPSLIFLFLLLYGSLVAYFIIGRNISVYHVDGYNGSGAYMNSRLQSLSHAIEAIKNGKIVNTFSGRPLSYFLALIGMVLNINEAWRIFLAVQMIAASILLSFYPSIIYRLTKSLLVSLLIPFILHFLYGLGNFLYINRTDVYWAMSWVIAFSIPLIAILFMENWKKSSWYIVGATCIIISLANIIRVHASFPILILAIIAMIHKIVVKERSIHTPSVECKKANYITCFRKFAKRNAPFIITLCVLMASYTFVAKTMINVIYRIYIGESYSAESIFGNSGPWHSAYIGFGWEDNKYGISYSDRVSEAKVYSIDPSATYLSNEYNSIIRREYFNILKSDPAFFFSSYFRKFMACIKVVYFHCIQLSWLCSRMNPWLLTALSIVILIIVKKFLKKYYNTLAVYYPLILSCVFCVFAGLIQAMIAVPELYYLYGSITAGSMLIMTVYITVILRLENIAKHKIYICLSAYKKELKIES